MQSVSGYVCKTHAKENVEIAWDFTGSQQRHPLLCEQGLADENTRTS